MQTINFDEYNLTTGTVVSDQFDGVKFSSSSEFGAMLFDTNSITGEDFDLASPDLDNVLIISEDGDSSNPDDRAAGGTINLKFDDLVSVNSIGLLDIDEPGGSITLYDADSNPVETVAIENLRDNSFQELGFDLDGSIASLEINLAGSGAVTDINFEPVAENSYSNIYVFGDSLSETGNLFNATTAAQEPAAVLGLDLPIIPPSPPYFKGRFSNGEIWLDRLAEELNLDLTPATELSVLSPGSDIPSPITLVEGNPAISPFFNGNTVDRSVNFAYGSATTESGSTSELGEFIPGIEQQVDFFITDHLQAEQTADPDALYVLWGGSNDYLGANSNPDDVIDNIEAEIESLHELGAREFLLVNLPDLGAIPEVNNPELAFDPAALTQLTDTHNTLLDSSAEELNDTLTGAKIEVLDVNALFDEIVANPDEFGITNVTESFLDPTTFTPTAGANPDKFLFYDTFHPTAAVHALVGDLALETLNIEAEI